MNAHPDHISEEARVVELRPSGKMLNAIRGFLGKPKSFRSVAGAYLFLFISILVATCIWMLWQRVSASSVPRFFEMQQSISLSLEARFLGFIQAERDYEVLELSAMKGAPESYYLPRWPLESEIFIGLDDRVFVIGRMDEKRLWKRPLADLNSFWKSEDGFAYLVTTGGINLGSSRSNLMTSKDGMKRIEIDDLFVSGIGSGVRAYREANNQTRVIAHRAFVGTNVVALVERSLNQHMETIWKDFVKVIYYFCLVGIIAFIAGLCFIARFGIHFRNVIAEDLGSPLVQEKLLDSSYRDELFGMRKVYIALRERADSIKLYLTEERRLRRNTHHLLVSIARSKNRVDVLNEFALLLLKHPNEYIRLSKVNVYLRDPSVLDSGLQVYRKYHLIQDGVAVSTVKGISIYESQILKGQVGAEFPGTFLSVGLNSLICSLSSNGILFGYFEMTCSDVLKVTEPSRKRLLFLVDIFATALPRHDGQDF